MNLTELKRLAEAVNAESAKENLDWYTENDLLIVGTLDRSSDAAYIAAASPDVVLEMIDALDVQAGSIEAVQAVNQRLASERDRLRTQNQALVGALKDADYLVRAFENDCVASDYARDIEDYRAKQAKGAQNVSLLAQAEGGV